MLVVGLTGSIGMGKSTVAARFRDKGIPVFDADSEVHKLYQGPAAAVIENSFPGTAATGSVDRAKLAEALGSDPAKFKRLEAIVHPLVWQAEKTFLKAAAARGEKLAVLEIPLLFEAGSQTKMDAVIVVSTSAEIQGKRVLQRPGMTNERLQALLNRQMSDAEKRQRADFLVETGGSMDETLSQTDAIITKLSAWPAKAFQQYWF